MNQDIDPLDRAITLREFLVYQLRNDYSRKVRDKPETGNNNGGNGGGSDMGARVTALEKAIPDIEKRFVGVEMRLHSIEVNMTHMAANMATKADLANLASKDDLNEFIRASGKDMQDLAISFHKDMQDLAVSFHKAVNDQTWKFIAVAGVLAGLAFTAARFI